MEVSFEGLQEFENTVPQKMKDKRRSKDKKVAKKQQKKLVENGKLHLVKTTVYWYIHPLLIVKKLCELENVSINFPCALLYVSFIHFYSFFFKY